MTSIPGDLVVDSSNTAKEPNDAEIFTYSPNPENLGPTIIFLHGLGSSHLEFANVYPHLQEDYHILLVDLPGHSQSKHLPRPYNYQSAAEHVHRAIQKHAHGGQAHVVGLSMGGFVGLQLTRQAPDCVQSLFSSGAAPFGMVNRALAKQPWFLYLLTGLTTWFIPLWVYNKLCDWVKVPRHPELRKEMGKNVGYFLINDGFTSLLAFGKGTFGEVGKTGKRVLLVAGGKGDDVKRTESMGTVLRDAGSPLSRASVVRKALHGWDVQYPQLFAAGVKAWIEEKVLPIEFEELDSAKRTD
jgi:pimeloyl-ACP methyl ester carboxylesterase